jgi:hypothetical protein
MERPKALWVRWPGGMAVTVEVPPETGEIELGEGGVSGEKTHPSIVR